MSWDIHTGVPGICGLLSWMRPVQFQGCLHPAQPWPLQAGKKRATGRRSDLISHSPPPTLPCQERALDPTGSAHLPSLAPRGSQRQPPVSPEQPAPHAGAPPVAAHRGGAPLSVQRLHFAPFPPQPSPSPSSRRPPPARRTAESRQRRRRHCALLRRWEPAGLGPGRAARTRCRGSRPPAVWASGAEGGRGHGRGPRRAGLASMIGVNSIHSSAGRLRSRSLCSVRYGRTHRGAETLCYGWPQRSRSLKPVLYTDLVVSRLQSRKKKKAVRALGRRPTPG